MSGLGKNRVEPLLFAWMMKTLARILSAGIRVVWHPNSPCDICVSSRRRGNFFSISVTFDSLFLAEGLTPKHVFEPADSFKGD